MGGFSNTLPPTFSIFLFKSERRGENISRDDAGARACPVILFFATSFASSTVLTGLPKWICP